MTLPGLRTILGQPSWPLKSSKVQAYLTQLGGHLGPVTFRLGRKTIAPFAVAPWAEEKLAADTPAILRALRGDFFCAPFGNGATWRSETHPSHGEPANATWRLQGCERDGARVTLHATLKTTVRPGRIDKFVTLVDGQTVLYQRHLLRGRGVMPVGHHAMLAFPDGPGSGLVSTSRFIRGQVFPGAYCEPATGSYQSLKPGGVFRSLARVPALMDHAADLTRFPARAGFDDVVMVTADPKLPFAWTAVTFPKAGYVWFALRDPRQLRHTVLWHSNRGRHNAPWNGRHTNLGLEEVTAYFQYGLRESVLPNPLSRRGIPTTIKLDPKEPAVISNIMAVAAIPPGFDHVAQIHATRTGVELVSKSGRRTRCAVDLGFINAS